MIRPTGDDEPIPCGLYTMQRDEREESAKRDETERENRKREGRAESKGRGGVTKDDEEAWWWRVPTDRKWEEDTIEEIKLDLLNQNWLFGHFPHYQTAIVCTREPTEEEISQFLE